MTETYWCELAWLGGESAAEGVTVEVEGERIANVTTGVANPPPDATRLDGLTIPSLANAHSHAFQRALRGRTQSGQGDFWSWREAMYELASRLDPDLYLALARATFAEMALAGITCVGEFHYLHHGPDGTPYADPNAMGHAVIQAAREAGIRITLLDACYLHGGIGKELAGAQRRFGDGDAERWAERVGELEGDAAHPDRRGDPQRPRGRPRFGGGGRGLGGRAGGAAPRAPVRAAGRERGFAPGLRSERRQLFWPTPAHSGSASPPSIAYTSAKPTSGSWAVRAPRVACVQRRNATSRTGSRRRSDFARRAPGWRSARIRMP